MTTRKQYGREQCNLTVNGMDVLVTFDRDGDAWVMHEAMFMHPDLPHHWVPLSAGMIERLDIHGLLAEACEAESGTDSYAQDDGYLTDKREIYL